MGRVLKAKYDAGLLKPFNYIKGYARLGTYLDTHIAPSSKQKILRTINSFRPKFREKAQALTDMELVYVEMWFERQLMDYDRVFAAMAVPACCWRRTGEIFRGNKEMAELIGVSVDKLRDVGYLRPLKDIGASTARLDLEFVPHLLMLMQGKIALHEILTEESMVRYWEEFGTIAFDPQHETLLTACSLKNPMPGSNHPILKCCFSFMIRRDEHKLFSADIFQISASAACFLCRLEAIAQFLRSIGMAPTDPITTGRERKIDSIIDFSKDLLAKLQTSYEPTSIEAVLADLNHHIHTVKDLTHKVSHLPSHAAKELKRLGRALYNECIKERRKKSHALPPQERSRLLVRTRVFAFQIHTWSREASRKAQKDIEGDIIYMVNMALTVARVCIEDSDLEGARLGLHKVAEYMERLKTIPETPGEGLGLRSGLEAEFLTIRTALSWKEDRLDVAEHMYRMADEIRLHIDTASAEHMADTLHRIGSDLSSKGDYPLALKWLRRAYELINNQDLERLSAEGLELRLAICHDLVQALLGLGSPEYLQEANDLVGFVESEIGDKPVVLHWRLEILQKSPDEVFDTEACASILRRMIRAVDFSDAVFSFLLHNIKDLREKNAKLAIGLLDELLLTRLLQSSNSDWLGKAIIRRIWMSTMEPESSNGALDLTGLLGRVAGDSCATLSPDVTGAAQSLIWKKLDAIYVKKQFEAAELWCRVALHPLFATSCGDANKGKFGRKLIICSIARNDLDAARSAFHSMPEIVQNDALTRYLMFRASLIGWDYELGRQSIEYLSKCDDKARSQDMLYACLREAQQVGDKLCTLAALKAVAENFDPGTPSAANFPSILRCTIKLIHLIQDQEDTSAGQRPDFVEDTCKVFETAAEHAKLDPWDEKGNKVFTVPELEWFQISLKDVADMALMAMRCNFVNAAALISMARTEDRLDEQLQRYLEMRQHVEAFDSRLQTEVGSQDGEVINDLVDKMSTLFVFDFEGAVYLKSWDDLSQIVRKARVCKDELMYKAMGDCLLRSQASGKVLYATLRLIINEIFTLEEFDNQRLAKYIRCMFQAILPLDDNLALQVVDQALQIAREGSKTKPFPAEELDWMVATTFNHAIDVFARGDEGLCHRWALKALDLAEYMDDGGDMRDGLQERVVKLGLNKDVRT
ncbi:hypothetical protein G7046_g9241 [Stylonectria norvegica]|nr:hypothetical protein G7046_g9241 [Stylonectria norvegica]